VSLVGDALNAILAVGGLLVDGFALWFSLLGLSGYKTRLRNEPAVRFHAAKALTARRPWDMYLDALEGALARLTSWIGERARLMPKDGDRGDWDKSANWCLTLTMIYPFVFLLTSWLAGGTRTVGEVEFLPPLEDFQSRCARSWC
jgi:hypothetical protein